MLTHPRMPVVFVVDDDPITNRTLEGILTRAGFQVASATDVAGALAGVQTARPDLVLLDVNLPDGSGLEVCRRLQDKAGPMKMPVLFISADDDLITKVKGFEAGGVDYIPKPFAAEEVIARVSTHLRLKHAYESLAELQAERIQRLAVAQETLMPAPASLPGAQFSVCLKQALQAGGDFYDVIPVGDQVVDYVVADASGHDLAASFWTAALKTLLSEYASAANSPRHTLQSMNSALSRVLPEGVFFTLLYARLNRQTGRLTISNAGHPPAVILRRNSDASTTIPQEADVLGAFADASFSVTEAVLQPGDRFFLYSDGLIEATGNWERGRDRLTSLCGHHRESPLATMVEKVVADAIGDLTPTDDILLMGVEV